MEEILFQRALQLISAFSIPSTFKAVVDLGVLDIIDSGGLCAQLSASEIASKIPTTNPNAPVMLDRMLRYLASHSLLTWSEVTTDSGTLERRYGLASVCMIFIKNKPIGSSLASLLSFNQDRLFQESWQEQKYAVLDGVIPFSKAHGVEPFEYARTDTRFGNMFNQCMSAISDDFTKKMLDAYGGFEGIRELVDVGGGLGTTISMIVSKYPKINGINFDLPQVIEDVPSLSGIRHVGGDMFADIPKGDAIFMKFILHDWDDEHCSKLLKNCYKSLPSSGKVIIVDSILPEILEPNVSTQNSYWTDLVMMTYHGGKERTKKEFELLAKEAGFSVLKVACCLFNLSVMEILK